MLFSTCRKSKFENKVSSVTKLNNAAMKDLIDAASDISNATLFTGKMKLKSNITDLALDDIGIANANMNTSIETLTSSLPELTNLTNEALNHASNLRDRVRCCFFIKSYG